jgi:hypothetical protein
MKLVLKCLKEGNTCLAYDSELIGKNYQINPTAQQVFAQEESQ